MWRQEEDDSPEKTPEKSQEKLTSRALELLKQKARSRTDDFVPAIKKWAEARNWSPDGDGRLRAYFLHVAKDAPQYELITDLYVSPGTRSGYFEHQNGGEWSGAEDGWFVVQDQDGFVVWSLGEAEPGIVIAQRGRKAKERVFVSDPHLREYLAGLFDAAPGEASAVTHAQQVWGIITTSKFAEKGEAERLFRVSIALHLHGGDIYDKAVQYGGYSALSTAFAEALSGAGRMVWLEGRGKDALQGGDRGGFVAWSQEFWNAITATSTVSEATVGKMFNHNKGYNRGISYAQESAGLEAEPGTVLLLRLLEGAEKYGPLPNLITAFNQMTLLKYGMKYSEFKALYEKFEQTVKQVYPSGVDITSATAKKTLEDDYGIE